MPFEVFDVSHNKNLNLHKIMYAGTLVCYFIFIFDLKILIKLLVLLAVYRFIFNI